MNRDGNGQKRDLIVPVSDSFTELQIALRRTSMRELVEAHETSPEALALMDTPEKTN